MPSFASVKDEEAIRSQKGFYILGRDIREIACLRPSLLLGITCGTITGLISFMATSKAGLSSHIGFGSLWVFTFAYWIPCRYKYETGKALLKDHALEYYEKAAAQRDMVTEVEEEKKD